VNEAGKETSLQAGDFALVNPSEKHQYRNKGDKPFKMICGVLKDGEVILLPTPKKLFHMNSPEEIIFCFDYMINITAVNKHRTNRKMFRYFQLS